jgi:hypothetical protein
MSTEETGKPSAAAGGLAPEMIERFREVGLRLDRSGRLWHQGEEITHPRLKATLLRWLDRREDDGRPIIRLDEHRYAYIEIEDAELLAVSARWEGERAILALSDEREEELAYASLRVGEDNALYCEVRGGRLEARLTTAAYFTVAERIEEGADGGFELVAAGSRFPIRERRPRPSVQTGTS